MSKSNQDNTTAKTLKIGVTGGAGSGKTFVCNYLKKLGLNVISSDDLARRAVEPGMPAHEKIVNHFGQSVLLHNGTLDRAKLRGMITEDKAARTALERFVHPQIDELIKLEILRAQRQGERFLLLEVPLLFELGIQGRFDLIVLVSAERELRIQRLMQRDNVERREAEALLNVQLPDAHKNQQVNYVIKNNGSLEELKDRVAIFHKELIKNMQKKN